MPEIWVEKYRPQSVKDVILPARLRVVFDGMVEKGDIPNMILAGPPGVGKTTIAKALCRDLNMDFFFINGSEDGNIDTLRDKVRGYASTVSLNGNKKVIFFDEADHLNPKSTQPALRGFIEEFADNCRFIFTANYKARLIEPLHSRCATYEFGLSGSELAECAAAFWTRLDKILTDEGVAFEREAILELIRRFMPDWRRILNECQRYSAAGRIDVGILHVLDEKVFDELLAALRAKDFKGMRKWVAAHSDLEPTTIFRKLYDCMDGAVKAESRPALIVTLADYDYKSAFVADREINMAACLTEVMRDVTFQ